MNETTLCWYCCHAYAIELDACPMCGATNGNVDPQRALDELRERSEEARRRLTRARYMP
jgi:rRNA maturation protein Nop10